MGRIVHFEIAADNPQRAQKFYKEVFGWEIKDMSQDGMEYWLVTTGPKEELGINGGIMRRQGKRGAGGHNAFVCCVDIADIEATRKKIVKAGGKLTTDVTPIFGVGKFCYCKDTEGNSFSVMQS
jgi:hypothetical protein